MIAKSPQTMSYRSPRTMIYRFTLIDHCTGRRIASQTIARSRDHLATLLVSIYGRGIEIISIEAAS